MSNPVVAFVFARGGSKGVPRKNIRPFMGEPLIARAIRTAQESVVIDRVVVSTDDEEIADVARRYGAEVPFLRPSELAADDSSEFLAWKHAIAAVRAAGQEMDVFVSVPCTSPLRSVDDVDACIRTLQAGGADLVLTVTPARRHPMFNMVTIGEDGLVRIVNPPASPIRCRQDAPPVFDVCTVAYAATPSFVLGARDLLGGRTRAVVVPPERSLDIDTEFDFFLAEIVAKHKAH